MRMKKQKRPSHWITSGRVCSHVGFPALGRNLDIVFANRDTYLMCEAGDTLYWGWLIWVYSNNWQKQVHLGHWSWNCSDQIHAQGT